MSSEITVYSESTDGHMYAGTDAHFSNARDASSADSIDVSSIVARIGLDTLYSPDTYGFYRVGLAFDTSSIPDGATILSATMSLYLVFGLTIIPAGFAFVLGKMASDDGTYPHNPLVVGDFDRTHYVGGGASTPWVYSGQSGYKEFTFTETGKASWINDQGLSKFIMMTSLDIGYSIPTAGMLISVYTQERGAGYRPKLYVSYATPCTVTTGAATVVLSSGATGNGNITDAGAETITQHGVIWNDDGSDPVDLASADNYTEEGAGSTGTFTSAISGCDAETAYYYRAYATTVAGTSVGSAVLFTTIADSTILAVTTQATTVVGVTTATANGTIVEDAGHDLSAYGFVYKLGGDPGTPADPTDADNYTDKGSKVNPAEGTFTSDLTGLTATSTYFIRAYATTAEDGTAYGSLLVFYTGTSTEVTLDGDDADGYAGITKYGSLADALNASIADAVNDDHVYIYATIEYTYSAVLGHRYYVRRGYVYFDGSSIPAGATILSAVLRIYLSISEVNFSPYFQKAGPLYVSAGMPTYPHDPLVVGDYGDSNFSDIVTVARDDITDDAYLEIDIPPENVTAGGWSKYRLNQDKTAGSAYTTMGYTIDSAEGTNTPELVVTYALPQTPSFPLVNIGDAWVEPVNILVNIGDKWISYLDLDANIGDSWVETE